MGLFTRIRNIEHLLTDAEKQLIHQLAQTAANTFDVSLLGSTPIDYIQQYYDTISGEGVTQVDQDAIISEVLNNVNQRAYTEPVKDAYYYLLEISEEQNELYTHGNELYNAKTKQEYSGNYYTKLVNGELKAYAGFTPTLNGNIGDEPIELMLKSLPEEIQDYYKLTTSVFELKVDTDIKAMSDFATNDAAISIRINDNNSTPPYFVKWFRTDENNNTVELRQFENKLTADNLTYSVYRIEISDSNSIPTGAEIGVTVPTSTSGSGNTYLQNLQIPDATNQTVSLPYRKTLIIPIYQPEPTLNDAERNNIEADVFRRLQEQFAETNEDIEAISYRLTQRSNDLNEDAIIKRILDGTDLDERLYDEYVAAENARMGIIVQSPDTEDRLNASRLGDDIAPADLDDRILNRLLENLPSLNDLLNQSNPNNQRIAGDNTVADENINTNYNRNRLGFITSNESTTEGLIDVELIDTMIRTETFSNIVDVEFDQLKSESAIQSEVESLENKIKLLEQDIIDLQTSADGLINDRVTQENDINVKEQTIRTLEKQLEELRNRFAFTPAEGTFFSIPLQTPTPKEKIDYWLIEGGKRRRLQNYSMLQVLLSAVKRTITDVQILQPEHIAKIERGNDITLSEIKDPFVRNSVANNVYVSDEYLDAGKKVRLDWWEDSTGTTDPGNNWTDPPWKGYNIEVSYEDVLFQCHNIGVYHPSIGQPIPAIHNIPADVLACSFDYTVRPFLLEHAIWWAALAKLEILRQKELAERLIRLARAREAAKNRSIEIGKGLNEANFKGGIWHFSSTQPEPIYPNNMSTYHGWDQILGGNSGETGYNFDTGLTRYETIWNNEIGYRRSDINALKNTYQTQIDVIRNNATTGGGFGFPSTYNPTPQQAEQIAELQVKLAEQNQKLIELDDINSARQIEIENVRAQVRAATQTTKEGVTPGGVPFTTVNEDVTTFDENTLEIVDNLEWTYKFYDVYGLAGSMALSSWGPTTTQRDVHNQQYSKAAQYWLLLTNPNGILNT